MNYFKYPRTRHLPDSRAWTPDDKRLTDTSMFEGLNVVVTEKMDGENTSMYSDHIHARSIDSRHHESRDWVKRVHGEIKWHIPDGWRLCGENLFAQHSVSYDNLDSYFYLFSIWDENNKCLSWEETVMWAEELKVQTVPVLYEGLWDEKAIKKLGDSINTTKSEGFVVRNTESFHYDDFGKNLAKWVREGHVQSDKHWMHQQIKPNGLK